MIGRAAQARGGGIGITPNICKYSMPTFPYTNPFVICRVTQVYLIDIQGSPDLLRRISGVGITPNMCKYIFACMQVSMRIFIDMWGEPGISNRHRGNWNDTK